MVKKSGLPGCPVLLLCWWMEDGALRCSLTLSPHVLPDLPMNRSGQFMWGACELVYYGTFLKFVVLVLGAIRSVLTVFVPLRYACILMFLHVFLNLSSNPCM